MKARLSIIIIPIAIIIVTLALKACT